MSTDNGQEAIIFANKFLPDLIIMDIMMPVMDGFRAMELLKKNDHTKLIPIIAVTALNDTDNKIKALEAGAEDFLVKPIERLELLARVRSLLKIKSFNDFMLKYQQELELEVDRNTKKLQETISELKESNLDTILLLSRVAEFRDQDTGEHILRVKKYSGLIAENLGLGADEVKNIMWSSTMHDLGKISIPDSILLKPGKLDQDEWEIMKKHTIIGQRLLKNSKNSLVQLSAVIALSHHEKWDGSGYPFGLADKDIPLPGRIVALADVFDALTSKRPYKEPVSFAHSLEIIEQASGSHFDPEVVRVFISDSDRIRDIMEKYKL